MSRKLLASAVAAMLALASTASAHIFTFEGTMLGSEETPANASPAVGFTTVMFDTVLNQLMVQVNFSGLVGGNAAAAHIHCCTAPGTNTGVAVAYPGFPAATSGSYANTFDLTAPGTYTTGFRNGLGGGTAAGAEAALLNGLLAGQAYSNIHDANFPGGEIRAFLQAVPEPSAWALMIGGFALAGTGLRRRRAASLP